MKTPIQEAVAQVVFWTGMGCWLLSVILFGMAFRKKKARQALSLLLFGGLAATHFMWYFTYLGRGLATTVEEFHPIPWLYFCPIGLGIALVLAFVWFMKNRDASKNQNEHSEPSPPPLHLVPQVEKTERDYSQPGDPPNTHSPSAQGVGGR
ncbi:MAG: hypothetical protein EOM62_15220 [Bacteroidia bacterium]|nr:hypothetical protein [Bacteroidia bacterium]